VPADIPVTIPVLETVATNGFEVTQGVLAFGEADPVSVVVAPMQADKVPVIVGAAVTLTVAFTVQPFEFVYVITELPTETAETTPPEVIVTRVMVAEIQGLELAGVPVPVNVVVFPTHMFNVPVITGAAIIVTNAVAVQLLKVL
jgi:hypothetical protein